MGSTIKVWLIAYLWAWTNNWLHHWLHMDGIRLKRESAGFFPTAFQHKDILWGWLKNFNSPEGIPFFLRSSTDAWWQSVLSITQMPDSMVARRSSDPEIVKQYAPLLSGFCSILGSIWLRAHVLGIVWGINWRLELLLSLHCQVLEPPAAL